MTSTDEPGSPVDDEAGEAIDPRGVIRDPTLELPAGYCYGVTRFADVVLANALPERFSDLVDSLDRFTIDLHELRVGGGGRTTFVRRFDASIGDRVDADGESLWGKRNITIQRSVGFDGGVSSKTTVRGHEIDMFGQASSDDPFPGVAVEMEWNNKDPFFDRDLINFQALHREGAVVAGVIVTRGPVLQATIGGVIRSKDGGYKYGQSSTHWDKLVPRVNLGGGGECPLLLVGIEPPRIRDFDVVAEVRDLLLAAADLQGKWRASYSSWNEAKGIYAQMRKDALDRLPPVADEAAEGE